MISRDYIKQVIFTGLKFIIGFPNGYAMEGSKMWYYVTAVAMSNMLVAWKCPEVWLVFGICSLLHLSMTALYGHFNLGDNDRLEWVYGIISFIMLITALCFDGLWALITSCLVFCGQLLAPDEMGCNICMHGDMPGGGNIQKAMVMVIHALWNGLFMLITFLLPIPIGFRILIAITAVVIHPLLDILEGEWDPPALHMELFWELMQDKFMND